MSEGGDNAGSISAEDEAIWVGGEGGGNFCERSGLGFLRVK